MQCFGSGVAAAAYAAGASGEHYVSGSEFIPLNTSILAATLHASQNSLPLPFITTLTTLRQ